jgi:hypothetical protein
MTARLRRRVDLDFPSLGSRSEVARIVAEAAGSERVQAAIVLWAAGDMHRVRDSIHVATQDWRDVLVRGGLAGDDWRERLDAELGTDSSG